jgi:hypothetical protein
MGAVVAMGDATKDAFVTLSATKDAFVTLGDHRPSRPTVTPKGTTPNGDHER